MKIADAELDGVPVLRPDGALRTAADASALETRLRALLRGGTVAVVLDCAQVAALGSAAVRVLLRVGRQLNARNGGLVLLRVGAKVRRALEVSGFDKDFTLAKDEKAARVVLETLPARRASAAQRELAIALLQMMGESPLAPPDAARRERLAKTAAEVLAITGGTAAA
jgi:anti-anti-sigma factor